ncbi:hypothetical protein QTL95_25065 [Rhizobium sp. S152]|uniref:hypothetical protein n=1 Tax=Rhizobium sp. S152 TaxID=3055038 RepID=UPI0025A9C2F9|nr:hypothetical protein [Rhizobium sp. S152]MDM9629165.1 hypothetical protein [Rhizobium sp. S152]
MSQISSVGNTSYAYLATLSRLDTNGDGVLSRSERAADEKPGIMEQLADSEGAPSLAPKLSDGVLAFMMARTNAVNGTETVEPSGFDALYQNTYGQYDFDLAS